MRFPVNSRIEAARRGIDGDVTAIVIRKAPRTRRRIYIISYSYDIDLCRGSPLVPIIPCM